eukprot:3835495-Pleurochrysis_carterae.AAC.1
MKSVSLAKEQAKDTGRMEYTAVVSNVHCDMHVWKNTRLSSPTIGVVSAVVWNKDVQGGRSRTFSPRACALRATLYLSNCACTG